MEETEVSRKREIKMASDTLDEMSVINKIKEDPETTMKFKCLHILIMSYQKIHDLKLKDLDPAYEDIEAANQIMDIIFTTFGPIRKQAVEKNENAEHRLCDKGHFSIDFRGKTIQFEKEDVLNIIIGEVKLQGLEFGCPGSWYGKFLAYLDFFSVFPLRMEELEFGNADFVIKKERNKRVAFPVSKYGLDGMMHILLDGCSYLPEKFSFAIDQCLGPMTLLLLHIRSQGELKKRWTDAAKQSLAHLPYIEDILHNIKDKKPYEISRLLDLIGAILLITGSRKVRKMFFPINFLYKVATLPINHQGYIILDDSPSKYKGGMEYILKIFDLSETGGFYVYDIACNLTFQMQGLLTSEDAQQLCYHSIFGTHCEDLHILEQITELRMWKQRWDLDRAFNGLGLEDKVTAFKPVKMRMYSRLSSSIQTDVLAAPNETHAPNISCKDFFQMHNRKINPILKTKSVAELTSIMSQTITDTIAKIKKNNSFVEMGTSPWRKMDDIDPEQGGSEVDPKYAPVGGGKLFRGKPFHNN